MGGSWRLHEKTIFLILGCMGLCGGPFATLAEDVDTREMEEVVVIGSRIKRQDYTSTSPVFTIDEQTIELSGTVNIEDLLNDSVQFKPGFDRTGNNPGSGSAAIDLRGLGPHRTLVLLNGHRVASDSVFGAVDVNDIPAALLRRVEILTGGGAAVYGSDAVAGAVNFEIDTEYEGVTLETQFDMYGEGDGEVVNVNLAFGRPLLNGRGSLSGYLGWYDRQEVMMPDREFTAIPIIDDTETGTLVEGGSPFVPEGLGVFPPADLPGYGLTDEYIFLADGTARPFLDPEDLYNYATTNYLQIPMQRNTAGLFGRYDFDNGLRLVTELTWSDATVARQLAPAPFFGQIEQNVDHPLLTDYQRQLYEDNFDPGDGVARFFFAKRLSEVGPRHTDHDGESWRAFVGADGAVAGSWEWRGWYSYMHSEETQHWRNVPLRSRLYQGLLADPATDECFDPSNGCVPLTLLGINSFSEEAAAFVTADNVFNASELDEQMAAVILGGDVLPSLGIRTAFGLEWRETEGRFVASPEFRSDDVIGISPDSDIGGSTYVIEVFGEFVYPIFESVSLAQSLILEAGARFSDYSDAGDASTWKLGLDWRLTDWLRIRGMQQRAIRAPNIQELFQDAVFGVDQFGFAGADRCSATEDPVGNGYTDLCVAQGIPADQLGTYEARDPFPAVYYDSGGNTDLESEQADTTTVGFVIGLGGDASLAVDYWDIRIEDAIGTVNDPIGLCFELGDPDGRYCRMFSRGPSLDIVEVNFPFFNQAEQRTRGIDLQARYAVDVGIDGSLEFRASGSRMIEQGRRADPSSEYVDTAGAFSTFFAEFSTPAERINLSIDWHRPDWGAGLTWQWIGGLANPNVLDDPTTVTAIPAIGSKTYVNVYSWWTVVAGTEIRGGVRNLLEQEPPMLADYGQANTQPQIYDVFGRAFYLGATVSF